MIGKVVEYMKQVAGKMAHEEVNVDNIPQWYLSECLVDIDKATQADLQRPRDALLHGSDPAVGLRGVRVRRPAAADGARCGGVLGDGCIDRGSQYRRAGARTTPKISINRDQQS